MHTHFSKTRLYYWWTIFSLLNWSTSTPLQSIDNNLEYCKVGFQAGVQAETACEQGPSSPQDQLCSGTEAEHLTAGTQAPGAICGVPSSGRRSTLHIVINKIYPLTCARTRMRAVVRTGGLRFLVPQRHTARRFVCIDIISMATKQNSDLMVGVSMHRYCAGELNRVLLQAGRLRSFRIIRS